MVKRHPIQRTIRPKIRPKKVGEKRNDTNALRIPLFHLGRKDALKQKNRLLYAYFYKIKNAVLCVLKFKINIYIIYKLLLLLHYLRARFRTDFRTEHNASFEKQWTNV